MKKISYKKQQLEVKNGGLLPKKDKNEQSINSKSKNNVWSDEIIHSFYFRQKI